MKYASLAALALSASVVSTAAASPLPRLFHLHEHSTPVDRRVDFTLMNKSMAFREVNVAGQTYTINGLGTLAIKAPVGTVVYANTTTLEHKRGDVVLQVAPELKGKTVIMN